IMVRLHQLPIARLFLPPNLPYLNLFQHPPRARHSHRSHSGALYGIQAGRSRIRFNLFISLNFTGKANSPCITAAAYRRRRLSALGRLRFLGGRDIAVQRGICDSAAPIAELAPKGIALANNLLGREVRQPEGPKMLPPPGELGANTPPAT